MSIVSVCSLNSRLLFPYSPDIYNPLSPVLYKPTTPIFPILPSATLHHLSFPILRTTIFRSIPAARLSKSIPRYSSHPSVSVQCSTRSLRLSCCRIFSLDYFSPQLSLVKYLPSLTNPIQIFSASGPESGDLRIFLFRPQIRITLSQPYILMFANPLQPPDIFRYDSDDDMLCLICNDGFKKLCSATWLMDDTGEWCFPAVVRMGRLEM